MSSTTTALVMILVAIALLLPALVYIIIGPRKAASKHRLLPPGYLGWLHIGEVFLLLKASSSTTVSEFMKHRMSRFGKVFSTNILGQPAIVSADPDLNQFLLQNESRLLEHSFPTPQLEMLGKDNLDLQSRDAHKKYRSITVGFFNPARLRSSFLKDAEGLAASILDSWKDDSVISTLDVAKQYTFGIIAKNVLGLAPGEPESEKLRLNYQSYYFLHVILIPIKFPGTKYWKSMEARKYNLKVIGQLVEERKKKVKKQVEGSSKAEMEDDNLLGWIVDNTDLSPDEIGDVIQALLLGGYETTAIAITLMIYLLEGCPKAIQQLREEHTHVVRSKNGGNLTWDDYRQMEFTQCVVNETLRLGNVSRFIPKKASTDIQLKGYVIPQGCRIFLYTTATHLDASTFEDPEQFNPWRWMTSSGMLKTNNFMPFGCGLRACPGSELARLKMIVFLRHLILRHDWKLAEDDHPTASAIAVFRKDMPIKIKSLARKEIARN